jgi:hypothetical protein
MRLKEKGDDCYVFNVSKEAGDFKVDRKVMQWFRRATKA